MDLKEIGINTRNWLDLAQDRDYWRALVVAEFNLRVPLDMELVMAVPLAPVRVPSQWPLTPRITSVSSIPEHSLFQNKKIADIPGLS